jgi:alanine racemase
MSEVEPGHRSAWLEVDLVSIRHNLATIRSLAGATALAPVVKADAYGHGREAVVDALVDLVDAFCVATLDEALAVRRQAPTTRVLLLYPVPQDALGEAFAADIELTVMSRADLDAVWRSQLVRHGRIAVHLCLETGMGRGGLSPAELLDVVREAASDARIRLAGLWSHLASPEDAEASRRQVARFDEAVAALAERGVPLPSRHLAATGGLFAGTAPRLDLVRPGLAVYGMLGEGLPIAEHAREAAATLRPAMSLKARPVAISEVAAGEGVGYGSLWRAERPSRVAILPLGYADGYLRGAQPGAHALVRGRRAPLVGAISMDALAVDVSAVPGVGLADEFVLLGRQGDQIIETGELARARNTIAWEVLSGMAPRLARVYHRPAGTVREATAGAVPETGGRSLGSGSRGP